MTGTHTFLIVDDSEDNRVLAAYQLRKAFPGARIAEAEHVDTAMKLARELHPDAIVTDHHLGTAEGPWFMQELAVAGIHCPVIMVTSSNDPAVHHRAYEAGATRVFADSGAAYIGYLRRHLAPPAR